MAIKNTVCRAMFIFLPVLQWGIRAEPLILPMPSAEDPVINANEMEHNEDDNDGPPWAERNHFFWDIGIGASTIRGIEFSAGIGLSHGLLGIHFDYDYHQEFTWYVHPSEYQKIISLLAGPAFELKWFRFHLVTGISLMNYRSRGEIDSVHHSNCDSPFGCLGANDNYYHEEKSGNVFNWPVAVKWYYARKAFGVGMKLQANVNGKRSSCAIGAMLCLLIVRPDTRETKKLME